MSIQLMEAILEADKLHVQLARTCLRVGFTEDMSIRWLVATGELNERQAEAALLLAKQNPN